MGMGQCYLGLWEIRRMALVDLEQSEKWKSPNDCFVIAVMKIKNIGNLRPPKLWGGGVGLPCYGAKEICRTFSKYQRVSFTLKY